MNPSGGGIRMPESSFFKMEKELWEEINTNAKRAPDTRLEEILVKRYRLACVNERIMELILPI